MNVRASRADRLLAADDVAAERLVAPEKLLVHAADGVARRVEYMFISSMITPFSRSISSSSNGVAEHVDEDVERDVAVLGRTLDVVRVYSSGESVELAADLVDRTGDVPGARALLGALEEDVLGEVRDPAGPASS